jgi:hypothetical protein
MAAIGRDMIASPAPDTDGPLAGEDSLVLLSSTDRDDAKIAALTERLNAQNINVVLEIVRSDKGDCSFSNYAVLSGFPDYLNVTVGSDEGDKQRAIIDVLMTDRAAAIASQ